MWAYCMTAPLWRPGIQTKPISVVSVCFSCCYRPSGTEEPLVRGSGFRSCRVLLGRRLMMVGVVHVSLSLHFVHCTGRMHCHLLLSRAH